MSEKINFKETGSMNVVTGSPKRRKKRRKGVRKNHSERWLVAVAQAGVAGIARPYVDQRPLDEQLLAPRPDGRAYWKAEAEKSAAIARESGLFIPKVAGLTFLTGSRVQKFITPEEVAKRSIRWKPEE